MAGNTIASLMVEIGANVAQLRGDMDKSIKEIERLRTQSNKHAKDMETTFKSSIAGIHASYLKFTAGAAAALYTLGKAWKLAETAAAYEEQRDMLDGLGKKYNVTADGIVGSMQRASGGLIAKADLMQVALAGIAKGLKPEQLENLARAAETLGDAVGKSATTALEDLTSALETGRTKGLKNYLGTALDLEGTFGNLASKMTAAEKAQAMYAITMLEATKIQAQQKGEVMSAADKMEKMQARYKDITLEVGNFSKKLVIATADFLTWLVTSQEVEMELAMMQKKAASGYGNSNVVTKQIDRSKQEAQERIAGLNAEIEALKKSIALREQGTNTAKKGYKQQEEFIGAYVNYSILEMKRMALEDGKTQKKIVNNHKNAAEEKRRIDEGFFAGVAKGYKEMEESLTLWEDAGYESFYDFAENSRSTLSTVLFDGVKGDLKSFDTYWKAFWNSMLQSFADIVAKMVVEWAMGQVAMQTISTGTNTLGLGVGAMAAGGAGATSALPGTIPGALGTSAAGGGGYVGGMAIGPMLAAAGLSVAANQVVTMIAGGDKDKMEAFHKIFPFFDPIGSASDFGKGVERYGKKAAKGIKRYTEKIFGAKGMVVANQDVVPFATGDIFSSPTYFPLSGNKTGVMGEAGPEAIMPLKRGRDGKLGVQASGSNGIAFHFHGTIIDRKAVNEFAEMIYPRLKWLEGKGH